MSMKNNYEKEEMNLSEQSKAFVNYLTQRGMLSDPNVCNKSARERSKDRAYRTFHNTKLLLQSYRDIVWTMETIPAEMKSELDIPLEDLDGLIDKIDIEMSLENMKMESRLRAIYKSRVMIDRLNEAVNALKEKPTDGEMIYEVIYRTYIGPKPISILDLIQDLGLTNRRYYGFRKKGIDLISMRLWSSPDSDLELWMELLEIIEGN